MKKRILFLTQHFLTGDANASCLHNLIDELKETYDIEVIVYGKVTEPLTDDDITVHQIQGEYMSFSKTLRSTRKITILIPYIVKRIMARVLFKGKLPLWEYDTENIYLYKKIEEIVKQNRYDYVISVCDPFACHYFAYRLQKKYQFKWIAYYYDPYTFNFANEKNRRAVMRTEKKILKQCDAILCTDAMQREFSACDLKIFLPKIEQCEFPNLKKNLSAGPNKRVSFDQETVNCVFVGHLYGKIREPWFLFELLSRCEKKVRLYIVGGIYGQLDEEKMRRYQELLGEQLQMVGVVAKDEAVAIVEDADILINIGNTVENQLPSKIFDYISTGKPMVNICKINHCPTLPYTQKYPLCIDLLEEGGVTEEVAEKFSAFCQEAKGKRIAFEEIRETFLTSTPAYVAEQVKKLLETIG